MASLTPAACHKTCFKSPALQRSPQWWAWVHVSEASQNSLAVEEALFSPHHLRLFSESLRVIFSLPSPFPCCLSYCLFVPVSLPASPSFCVPLSHSILCPPSLHPSFHLSLTVSLHRNQLSRLPRAWDFLYDNQERPGQTDQVVTCSPHSAPLTFLSRAPAQAPANLTVRVQPLSALYLVCSS